MNEWMNEWIYIPSEPRKMWMWISNQFCKGLEQITSVVQAWLSACLKEEMHLRYDTIQNDTKIICKHSLTDQYPLREYTECWY